MHKRDIYRIGKGEEENVTDSEHKFVIQYCSTTEKKFER